jgi:hypothetical protein
MSPRRFRYRGHRSRTGVMSSQRPWASSPASRQGRSDAGHHDLRHPGIRVEVPARNDGMSVDVTMENPRTQAGVFTYL